MPCEVFSGCAAYVKNWIGKQTSVGEESITDWFLFHVSEKLPYIRYHKFNRHDEGRTSGADWEWWFLFPDSRSFSARVQAKRIRLDKDNYSGLAHTTQGILQIEKLISDARRNSMAAFYAFYTDSEEPTLCQNRTGNGIFWGEANKIHAEFIQNGRKKVTDSDILAHTTPIECLFCCPLKSRAQNGIDGLQKFIYHYFPTFNERAESRLDYLGFVETPYYVTRLLEEVEIPNRYESEYGNRFNGVGALFIIDFRDIYGDNPF